MLTCCINSILFACDANDADVPLSLGNKGLTPSDTGECHFSCDGDYNMTHHRCSASSPAMETAATPARSSIACADVLTCVCALAIDDVITCSPGTTYDNEYSNDKWYGVGSGYTLDSSQPFTVVTQFHVDDGTSTGTLMNVSRFYLQKGNRVDLPTYVLK